MHLHRSFLYVAFLVIGCNQAEVPGSEVGGFVDAGVLDAMPAPDGGHHDAGDLDAAPIDAAPIDAGSRTATPEEAARFLDFGDWVEQRRAEEDIPGVAFGVLIDNEVVFTAGRGHLVRGGDEAITGTTAINIQSVTKSVMAALSLRLVEQGRLQLDDTPNVVVVEAPHPVSVLNLENLLSHTSGLGYAFLPGHQVGEPTALSRNFAETELKIWFPAGALHAYVNTGYTLAAHLIQEKTGNQPYEDLMAQEVFAPLGLAATTFTPVAWPDLRFASLHAPGRFGESVIAATTWHPTERPAGGLYTTPGDLLRFANGLMQPGFLRQETLDSMRRSRGAPNEPTQGYGLGLSVERRREIEVFSHGGGVAGGNTNMVFVPSLGLAAVAMVTHNNLSAAEITDEALRVFGEVPATTVDRLPDTSLWDGLSGLYEDNHWLGDLEFAHNGGAMSAYFVDDDETVAVSWWGPRHVVFAATGRLRQLLGVDQIVGIFVTGNDGEDYLVTRIGVPQKRNP